MIQKRIKGAIAIALSKYERQILSLVARAFTPQQIAERLGRNRVAIYGALVRLRDKLAATSNAHAVEVAVDQKLLKPRRIVVSNPLSTREQDILVMVATGESAATIAKKFCVARSNIRSRYSLVKAKLRVNSLEDAVREADRLGFIDRRLVPALLPAGLRKARRRVDLTERQRDVLALLSRGISSRAKIGRALGISEDTVSGHIQRLRAKLGSRFPGRNA